ncbi:MAG TPA: hypothetical protein PKA19_03385 [Bacillota bacterium]|nr:hypothetical protein [Bacillota bacterium]
MTNNEIKNYEDEAGQAKKIRTGKFIALGVVALYVLFGSLILTQNSVFLPVSMGIITLLFAPVTAFFYIREVKRGVFKVATAEDEAAYEEMMRKEREKENKQ